MINAVLAKRQSKKRVGGRKVKHTRWVLTSDVAAHTLLAWFPMASAKASDGQSGAHGFWSPRGEEKTSFAFVQLGTHKEDANGNTILNDDADDDDEAVLYGSKDFLLFRHSCDPSAFNVHDTDQTMYVVAARAGKAGEDVTLSLSENVTTYPIVCRDVLMPQFSRDPRVLRDSQGRCQCQLCVKERDPHDVERLARFTIESGHLLNDDEEKFQRLGELKSLLQGKFGQDNQEITGQEDCRIWLQILFLNLNVVGEMIGVWVTSPTPSLLGYIQAEIGDFLRGVTRFILNGQLQDDRRSIRLLFESAILFIRFYGGGLKPLLTLNLVLAFVKECGIRQTEDQQDQQDKAHDTEFMLTFIQKHRDCLHLLVTLTVPGGKCRFLERVYRDCLNTAESLGVFNVPQ